MKHNIVCNILHCRVHNAWQSLHGRALSVHLALLQQNLTICRHQAQHSSRQMVITFLVKLCTALAAVSADLLSPSDNMTVS